MYAKYILNTCIIYFSSWMFEKMNWFTCLIFSCTLTLVLVSSTVFGTQTHSSKEYNQLKEIQHLNSPENIKLLSEIMVQIKASKFDKQRAPFYAYAARLKTNNGDFYEANQLLKKATKALPQLKDNDLLIDTFDYLSWVHFNRGDYAQAIFYLQHMANHAFQSKNQRGHTLALIRLGLSYLELNVNELAFPPLNSALEFARKNNNQYAEYLALLYLVNARIDYPDMPAKESMDLIEKAEKLSMALNRKDGYLTRLKGIVYQQLGKNVQAKLWLERSLEIAIRNNDLRLQRIIHKNLAEFYLANNQIIEAKQHALTSFKFANNLNHQNSMADLHLILSKVYSLEENKEKTLHHLLHYTDFIKSYSNQNIISLLTTMNKNIDNIEQREKITSLENSVLENKLLAQKHHNEQFTIILIIAFAFILLAIIYFIKTRTLSIKVALSMKDTLTGAFGRSYLQYYLPGVTARFAQNLDIKKSFGVIAIDCDDFKLINEQFGHAGGDKALKAIVTSLMKQTRPNDHLFRWGGDEFVLMCEHVSQQQLNEIAQQFIESINCLTINYDGEEIKPTISVGYALHKKDIEFDLGDLLKEADKYLYETKHTGKNNFIGSYI